MDGDLGFYTIKPDQMQVVNPLLILVFIPLYEVAFYPVLNLLGIRRPLQKIALGGVLAGVAFLCSMFVEINLEKTYPVLPRAGEAQLRIFNGIDCEYTVNTNLPTSVSKIVVAPNSQFTELNVDLSERTSFDYTLTSTTPNCANLPLNTFRLKEKTATSFFITGPRSTPRVQEYEDDPEKSSKGTPLIRVLTNFINTNRVVIQNKDGAQYNETMSVVESRDVPAGSYEIFVNEISVKKDFDLRLGGVYTIVIQERTVDSYVRL